LPDRRHCRRACYGALGVRPAPSADAQECGEFAGGDLVAGEVLVGKNLPVNGGCAVVSMGVTRGPLVSDWGEEWVSLVLAWEKGISLFQ
jgi:hypothetical protein